jgi:hypothetical protein
MLIHLIFKLPVNPLSNSTSRSLLGDSFPLTSALKFLHALPCKGVRTALPLSCLEVLAMLRVNHTTGQCTAILKEDEPSSSSYGSRTGWGCMLDHSWLVHQAECQSSNITQDQNCCYILQMSPQIHTRSICPLRGSSRKFLGSCGVASQY